MLESVRFFVVPLCVLIIISLRCPLRIVGASETIFSTEFRLNDFCVECKNPHFRRTQPQLEISQLLISELNPSPLHFRVFLLYVHLFFLITFFCIIIVCRIQIAYSISASWNARNPTLILISFRSHSPSSSALKWFELAWVCMILCQFWYVNGAYQAKHRIA